MPNWKKVVTSGSNANLNQITASGNISSSGTVTMLTASIGGGIFTSASLAAGGGGGVSFPTTQTISSSAELVIEKSGSFGDNLTVDGDISASGDLSVRGSITGSSILFNPDQHISMSLLTRTDYGAGYDLSISAGNYLWATPQALHRGGSVYIDGGTGKGPDGDIFLNSTNTVNNSVNIGTTVSSSAMLTVAGDISASGVVYASVFSNSTGSNISVNDITASGNISASGDLNIEGNITASGAISSSGTVYCQTLKQQGSGNSAFIGDVNIHGMASVGTEYTSSAQLTVLGSISASGDLSVEGDITASGDISSSGTGSFSNLEIDGIGGAMLEVDGDISASGKLKPYYGIHLGTGNMGTEWNSANIVYMHGGVKINNIYGLAYGITHLFVSSSGGNASEHARIGIGTPSASKMLTVAGDISASGGMYFDGDLVPAISVVGSRTVISSSSDVVLDSGDDIFFRSEGTDVMKLDGDNVRLGIGTNFPTKTLTVSGSISASGDFLHGPTTNPIISSSVGGGTTYIKHLVIAESTFNAPADIALTVAGDISASGNIYGTPQLLYETSSISSTGNVQGDIVKFGNFTTLPGAIYAYTGSTWSLAHSGSNGGASSSLALAVGTNSTTNGMLLRGMANIGYDPGGDNGCALYLETPGSASNAKSTTSGHIGRVVGWNYGSDTIYFNPDNTWIKRT